MSNWTTRFELELTRPYGVEEVHNVWFEAPAWSQDKTIVALLIPECELQVTKVIRGETVQVVNRPRIRKNVKRWLRFVCAIAAEERAWLTFACDTAEQVEQAADMVARLLPKYRRVPLERMYDPRTRESSGLS
jgi:hypothetical protein